MVRFSKSGELVPESRQQGKYNTNVDINTFLKY